MIPVLIQRKASWKPELMMKQEVLSNFLFLGLFASAVGFLLWNLSTKWIGAVKTSVYIYVSPVVTVVSVIGSALIFVGLVISQKRRATGDGV